MKATGCTLREAKDMNIEEAAFFLGISEEIKIKEKKEQDKQIKDSKRKMRIRRRR